MLGFGWRVISRGGGSTHLGPDGHVRTRHQIAFLQQCELNTGCSSSGDWGADALIKPPTRHKQGG